MDAIFNLISGSHRLNFNEISRSKIVHMLQPTLAYLAYFTPLSVLGAITKSSCKW